MRDFCVIIPAIKKNVVFADDLVKKLDGITLIERSMRKAAKIAESDNTYVVTDSQEICLICRKNGVRYVYRQDLRLNSTDLINELRFFLLRVSRRFQSLIVLWPYAPLIKESEILRAYEVFLESRCDVLTTLKEENHRVYRGVDSGLQGLIVDSPREKIYVELRAFLILRAEFLRTRAQRDPLVYPFRLDDGAMEIRTYQDWWICEKLLRRKRIVFRVIGYEAVGMGHIYRCLTLAREITDHEIRFVCDEKSNIAVTAIAGSDYVIDVVQETEMAERILALSPHLVINDILNTDAEYVLRLKAGGTKVVSFEDLGTGAAHTDLTINELYDVPQIEGKNIRWGHRYYLLRDEFANVTPQRFAEKVDSILVTFGGTDPSDLTGVVLETVADWCEREGIGIYVVAGVGYAHKEELRNLIRKGRFKGVEFTYATGVIAGIMEKTRIAIASNGRTVYELAHMNIPGIIISHHEREMTHGFSKRENGFINLGVYEGERTKRLLLENLSLLVHSREMRRELFNNTRKHSFSRNKEKVTGAVLGLFS